MVLSAPFGLDARGERDTVRGIHRTLVVAVTAGLVACLLAACGSSSSSSTAASTTKNSSSSSAGSGSAFTLLWIGDRTGPTKLYGTGELHGLESSVDYINAHGGMAGHQIKLVLADDGGSPSTAVSDLIKYLSSHPAPNAVWAGTESDETGALFPVLQQHKILALRPTDGPDLLANGSAREKYPDEFDPGSPKAVADIAAAAWFKSKGIKKVGILQESLDYTSSETPLIVAALEKQHIAYVTAAFPATATDVTPEVSALKSAGADAVFAEALGPAAGYALSARAKLGWSAPLLGDPAFVAIDVTTLVPKADLGNVFLLDDRASPVSASYTGLNEFKAEEGKLFGGVGGDGIDSEASSWDATMVIYTAANQAKSIDTSALVSALQNLQTTTEPYYVTVHSEQFTATDHENVAAAPDDETVIPAGPFVDGQVK